MSQTDFDLIIIGAGSAGYNGASMAVAEGLRVALIDGADELGGLCILRGCMPSKALIAGANRFEQARGNGEFGIRTEKLEIDLPTLIARKDRHIADFAEYRRSQIESGRFPFIHGFAEFKDSHTIEITGGADAGRRITSAFFLIATGSKLRKPELPGLAEAGFQHSDTILDHAHLPKSVVVLGAGAIGLEFAHYYQALGSHVTILQRSRYLLKGADHETSEALRLSLLNRGIMIHTELELQSVEQTAAGKRVNFIQAGEACHVEAEEIFYALGRQPNLGSLQLENTGASACDIQPTQQTNIPHIFMAGDACGPYEIVHVAIQQAELAVRNVARLLKNPAATGDLEKMDYRSKLFVLFTHPELGQVGFTETEAREKGWEIVTATYPFDDHGKSIVMGETDGLVKLVALKATGEILGASVCGPEASSLIHQLVAVMHYHGTAQDLLKMPHYHPTLAEIWSYPAEEIADCVSTLDAPPVL